MFVEFTFNIGDFVLLKTDSENKKRIVSSILIKSKSHFEYQLACELEVSWHSEAEIEKYHARENNSAGFKKT